MNSDTIVKYCNGGLCENEAIEIFNDLKNRGMNSVAVEVGMAFALEFSHNVAFVNDVAYLLFSRKMMQEAYDVYANMLLNRKLLENEANIALFNQHFSINDVADRYVEYDTLIVEQITTKLSKKMDKPYIVLTMTTCKRYALFEITVNSFLNCCMDTDMIDEWICVDDNSSESDRDKMMTKYPFFTFVWKNESDKGHARSMNIIRNRVLESGAQYSLHMEDDWKFFNRRHYITEAIEVLKSDEKIGQCLFNKNYAEKEEDIATCGGDFRKTSNDIRYYIHEMVETDEQRNAWMHKHLRMPRKHVHCNYWPHYSLRPSVLKTEVYEKVGQFDESGGHFEMEYAYRYFKQCGYVSAFLEGIYSLHIGRLTSERFDETKQNAYNLNNESQFVKKDDLEEQKADCEIKMKLRTVVVNLSHRTDRWVKFCENARELSFLNYERFNAINGEECRPTLWLQRLFDGNDYNMRVGLVGCAISHIKLYVELLESDYDAYLILEDDLEFAPEFRKKFMHLLIQLEMFDWDMVYLGHHLKNNASETEKKEAYDKAEMPRVEKWNSGMSFSRSLGGTGGYLINRNGAEKLLQFIEKNGMTNGIDTVQQKSADVLNIFYSIPHIYYSECWRGKNSVDTDIQHNFKSLTMPIEIRMKRELEYYGEKIVKIEGDVSQIPFDVPVLYMGENVELVRKNFLDSAKHTHRIFCLNDFTIFVIPIEFAPSRLKNDNGRWYIEN